MANDKLQFDVELNEGSINTNFDAIDRRAAKSAKASAAVFGEAFQKQEQDIQDSIQRLVDSTRTVAQKSAKESAQAFADAFKKQDDIYKASVKQNIDNAIKTITGSDRIQKSARDSASVFQDAFESGLIAGGPVELPVKSDPLAIKGVADLAGAFFLVKQAADLAGRAAKATLDVLLLGEKELALDRRFAAFAQSAGVLADVLRNDLNKAVKGLVPEGEILDLGIQAFVRIGDNARQLPQILDAARRSYKVFGGDIISNANAITTAIETGNARSLKTIGLTTDLEKAVKEYADQLNTIPGLLTEQQIQQARLNAILETSEQRFKNVDESLTPVTDAVARFKTQVVELGDQLSVLASKTFGKQLGDQANAATTGLQKINAAFAFVNKSSDDVEKLNFQIKVLEGSLKGAQKQLETLNTVEKFFLEADYKKSIEDKTKQLETLKTKLKEVSQAPAQDQIAGPTFGPELPSAEFIRAREQLVAKVQELNAQAQASDLALAQDRFNREQNLANLEALQQQQKLQALGQFQIQKRQLTEFFEQNGFNDEQLRQQATEALQRAHTGRLLQIQAQYQEQRKKLTMESGEQALTVGESFIAVTESMEQAALDLAKNSAKSFKQVGTVMLQGVGQAGGQAFAAFGAAVASGEDALSAFGQSLLRSIGQMSIQLGTNFILQGAAYLWAGLPNGPGLIAAGAALAAFGGLLSASGGAAAPGTGAVTGATGGGIAGGGTEISPIVEATRPEDTIAQTPQTAINLTINGNVLDRRQTGLEIAQVLEEQFREQGLVIRGA